MRNLKRALSLTLASVMLLGMMVMGTSAASFPDVDDNDNVEAIEVLNAVGVMIGDNGNFKPDQPVTRNEMAVIMAKLVLGTYEADSYVGTHPFNDVPSWADRYVAACYASGIVAGRSATTYDGQSTVTAVEAAAMMLRALGYEDLSKNAARWDQPVAAKANEINLFTGMSGASNAAMNRDAVAKLALNTLKATMVTTVHDSADIQVGDISIPGIVRYVDRNKIGSYDYTNGNDDNGLLELCEFLYDGKLVMNDNDTDAFGRKATTWTYDGDKVVTIADSATRTYTEEVKWKDIYKDLGLTVASQSASLTVDGEAQADITLTKTSADSNKLGGNGTLVEVFKDGSTVNITVVNTYLAQVSGDYDEDDEELTITAISDVTSLGTLDTTLSLEDFANLASFKDDDYVLITAKTDGTDAEVKTIVLAETVTANVTGYQKKNNGADPDTVTFDGSEKKYSANFDANGQSTDYAINEESVFIMDTYGYVIGLDEVAGSDDYVFIKEFDNQGNFTGTYIADAFFPDGTHKTITLDKVNGNKITDVTDGDPTATKVVASGNNYSGWYTYTTKNDEYSLTKVDTLTDGVWADVDQTTTVTENGKVAVVYKDNDGATATNSTVLVVKDGNKITTYTGIKNFPTIKTESHDGTWSWVARKDGYVKYMFVDVGDASVKGASSSSSDQIFILAADYKASVDSNENTFYTYDAIVNGAKTTVKTTDNTYTYGLYYDVDYDEDGYVDTMTKAADADADYDVKNVTAQAVNHSGGVVTIDTSVLVLTDDCMIRVIDGANGKTVTTIRDGEALAKKYDGKAITGTIYVVYDDNDYVTALYVRVTGTTNAAPASNAKLEATLSYTGTLAWAKDDTIQFTGTGLDVTFTYNGSSWSTTDTVSDYDTPTFDGSVLTVTKTAQGEVATNPFGSVTIAAKESGTTAIADVTGSSDWDQGGASANAALTVTVTGLVDALTWTTGDTVTVAGASGDLNSTSLVLTKSANGWDVTSGTPDGYTATFDGTKLTLEATTGGKVDDSPWGALTITVSCTDDGEAAATANNGGAGTWTTGSDAVG